MTPIRGELLNGVFVLVLASLMSAVFAAFQVSINLQLWVLILMAIAIAVGGYVVFEFVLSSERCETEGLKKTEQREREWLKRVGSPARLELGNAAAISLSIDLLRTMRPGTDYRAMLYIDPKGGSASGGMQGREAIYRTIIEQLNSGTIREYKRLVCFDHDVLASDPELKSGVLLVGEGPGTIERELGEHCRVMLESKGCALYIAPVVLRSNTVVFYGADKMNMTVDTVDQETGGRTRRGPVLLRSAERRDNRAIPANRTHNGKTDGRGPQDSLSRGRSASNDSDNSLVVRPETWCSFPNKLALILRPRASEAR